MSNSRNIYTVSRLNQAVRTLLEGSFPLLWVQGEISNLSRPASGHLYFSLKDERAQVRCALFRNRARLLPAPLANGQQVLARVRPGLYQPRGDFQLLVEHLEEAGAGALRLAYEALRLRLQEEGLFRNEHKQPLPTLPGRIGVITSPSGAALRDVLSVLQRRFSALPVLIYPTPVQGEGAGVQIAQALELACQRQDCDVLLLVRGGGSLEDLWAFNEEVVARAIHGCTIPLVCGVGHETDVTIADFAADLRAPTPSAAAELVSPNQEEWLQQTQQLRQRLYTSICYRLSLQQQSLHGLKQRLEHQHPGRRLQDQSQRLDEWEQRLHLAMKTQLERHRQRLQSLSRTLHAVSPLQILGRGYTVLRTYPDKTLIRHADQVQIGDRLEATLAQGRLICHVEDKQS